MNSFIVIPAEAGIQEQLNINLRGPSLHYTQPGMTVY